MALPEGGASHHTFERTQRVLIKIEKVGLDGRCGVTLDRWHVKFRTYEEAKACVEQLEARIKAPHLLPVSYRRPLVELS